MNNETQSSLATQILAGIRSSMKDAWSQLSPADQQLIANCTVDAAALQTAAIAATTPDAQEAVAREKLQINAQLANIASIGADAVRSVFWENFDAITNRAMAGLG